MLGTATILVTIRFSPLRGLAGILRRLMEEVIAIEWEDVVVSRRIGF
jgi:hypothetical protein